MSPNTLDPAAPYVFFTGDFNTGKSSIINALLHRDAVPVSREESRALPTFVGRSPRKEASFAGLPPNGSGLEARSHEEFLRTRMHRDNPDALRALAAQYPSLPFRSLVLVDTAGISGEAHRDPPAYAVSPADHAMLAVVTDIEYWASKHNMELIRLNLERFGRNLVVVANKTDHLNAAEVRKVRDKAAAKLESYGFDPAPRFFAISARLEAARREAYNEYRSRTRREVRELADAGFDALRVALYEFEAGFAAMAPAPALEALLGAPAAASFIAAQQEGGA